MRRGNNLRAHAEALFLPNLIHEIKDQKYDLLRIRKNAYQMVKNCFFAAMNFNFAGMRIYYKL